MIRIRWGLLPLVVLGGALGVAARESILVQTPQMHEPVATLAINVIGSALLGVAVGALSDRSPRWRALVSTGALGGFTTYSGFAGQAAQWTVPFPPAAALLVLASLSLGLAAAAAGVHAGRAIAGPGRDDADDPREAE